MGTVVFHMISQGLEVESRTMVKKAPSYAGIVNDIVVDW